MEVIITIETLTKSWVLPLVLIGCIDSSRVSKEMPNAHEIKSVDEIQEACGIAASTILPIEDSSTFPTPIRSNGHDYVQILFCSRSGVEEDEVIEEPHYCMWLDPFTAKVMRFWPCTPQEIGIEGKPLLINPPGPLAGIEFEQYMEKRDRLSTLSPIVWKLFFAHTSPSDPQTVAILKEYLKLYLETTNKAVARFEIEASSEFFNWLQIVVGEDR